MIHRENNLALVADLLPDDDVWMVVRIGRVTLYPVMSAISQFPQDFGG